MFEKLGDQPTRVAITGRSVDGEVVTEVLTLDGTNPVTTKNAFLYAGNPGEEGTFLAATRCPNCEKFVSLETEDPEIQSDEISGDEDEGYAVIGEVRIVRICADCSEELKEAILEFEIGCPEGFDPETWEYDLSVDSSERRGTHNKRGRVILNSRYQKAYYGAEITVTFTSPGKTCSPCNGDGYYDEDGSLECPLCEGTGKIIEELIEEITVDEQASFFEELT